MDAHNHILYYATLQPTLLYSLEIWPNPNIQYDLQEKWLSTLLNALKSVNQTIKIKCLAKNFTKKMREQTLLKFHTTDIVGDLIWHAKSPKTYYRHALLIYKLVNERISLKDWVPHNFQQA